MKKQKVLIHLFSCILVSLLLVGCSTFPSYLLLNGNDSPYSLIPLGIAYHQIELKEKSNTCSERTKNRQKECQKQVDDLVRSISDAKKRHQPIDQDN